MKKRWISAGLICLCLFLLIPAGTAMAKTVTGYEGHDPHPGADLSMPIHGHYSRFPTTSPWLAGKMDESIYENYVSSREDDQNISEKSPGVVEKHVSELLRNMASSLISLLQDKMGASIDRIVFGRVGSGFPNRVNIFAFELRTGNPYGVTASICYSLLRGMMYVFLGVCFIFQLVKAAWSGQTAKSREEIKSMFPTILVKFAAMALMPYLLDVALYVRDVVLYGIKEVTADMVSGGATLSLSETFLYNAERSGTFVDAVMYLGTVVLTIYFVFLYVSVAIDMLVCFVSFPFICVLHSKKKDLITGWIMTVFSNIMTPVIDAVLLLIPLLTSLMLYDIVDGISMIQLVMCMLIIPARSRFKALLGLQGNDRNGFLGAMALLSLGRAVAGKIKQGVGKIADAASDAGNSRTQGKLAEVDKEEEQSLLSDDAEAGKNKENEHGDGILNEDKGAGTDNGENEPGDLGDEEADGLLSEVSDKDMQEAGPMDGEDEELFGGDAAQIGTDAAAATAATYPTTAPASGGSAGTRGEALRDIDNQVDTAQAKVDGLKEQRAGLVAQEKQVSRRMLEHERGSDGYRRLERERADIQSKTAQMDSRIASENAKLNRLRAQSRQMHNAMGQRGTPTAFDDRRAEILRKRANISNFESPQFKGVLSSDQMRTLYRRRAIANGAKAVAGTVGAVALGTVAGSAAIFMGPSAVAMATAGGISAGSSIGQASVDVATTIGRVLTPAAKAVGNRAYHMADMAASAYVMNQIRPVAMQMEIPGGQTVQPVTVDTGIPITQTVQEIAPDTTELMVEQAIPASAEAEPVEIGMAQVAADAREALQSAMTGHGAIRSGTVLRAMQQANVELEREIAILREEGKTQITDAAVRERRIAIQTEAVTNAILQQMENRAGYERGSDAYAKAETYVRSKVSTLLEERDKPLV